VGVEGDGVLLLITGVRRYVYDTLVGFHARASYSSSQDAYTVAYWFTFKGIHLEEFRVSYKVKGPCKDHISSATYTCE